MDSKKRLFLVLLSSLLILNLFVLFSLKERNSQFTGHSTMTSDLGVGVGSSDHYFTQNFAIANETRIIPTDNLTIIFRTNNQTPCYGYFNATFRADNPTGNTFSTKGDMNHFLMLDTNLCFTNATISLNYSQAEITSNNIEESSLALYHYNNNSDTWEELDGTVNTEFNFVFGITNNFSTFGVFGSGMSSPSSPASPGSGGGGGGSGGGSSMEKTSFTVDPHLLTATLSGNTPSDVSLNVLNTGSLNTVILVEFEDLENFEVITEEAFILNRGETKNLKLKIKALTGVKAGIYLGKIKIKNEEKEEVVNIIVNLKDESSLFDIKVKVLPEYKQVQAGSKIVGLINLDNVGTRGRLIDVELHLFVTDFDKEVYLETSRETLAVGAQLATTREFHIPGHVPSGQYLLIGEMEYEGTKVAAYDLFEVTAAPLSDRLKDSIEINVWAIVSLAIILILITVLIAIYFQIKKHLKTRNSEQRKTKRNATEKKFVAQVEIYEQLEQLEKVYQQGILDDKEYNQTKETLTTKLEKLKKKSM